MAIENEIKLRIPDAARGRKLIDGLGFTVLHERIHEMNIVCDTSDGALREKGGLLRVRTAGEKNTVTFKGRAQQSAHKTREEIEFTASDAGAVLRIFENLGFHPVFRYEKYRTEFSRAGRQGIVTLDETPIGCFLELEGPAEWVDATAREMGFSAADYIKDSYGALYVEYCSAQGTRPSDMTF